MILADFFNEERTRIGATLEQMSYGLYTKSMMIQIESKDKEANRRYINRILQRLGIEDELNEEYVSCEEYDIYMLEEKIMNNISNKNYEQAGKELIEYKKQVKNNKVSLQFMTAMTAWIMREHNFSKEEISNTYKQSIRYTVPEFELSIDEYLLSSQEYNLILEYYNYMSGEVFEKCILKLIDKIENSSLTQYSRAKIYPKIVIYLSDRYMELEKIDDKELIRLGEKALELLISCGKMYYIMELLNVHNSNLLRYIKEHNSEDIKEYVLRRTQILQYMNTIVDIAKECNIDIERGNDSYLYEQRGIYSISDVIRTRRIMLGMTREELSDGICSVRTIMRIENRKGCAQKNIVRQLFRRLHLAPELTRTEGITSQRKAIEYEIKWNDAICRRDNNIAEKIQSEVHNYKWEDVIENRQCFENKNIIAKIQAGKIAPDEAERELKKILEYTVPYDSIHKKECYYTKVEMTCLYTIATLNKDKRIERLKRLIDVIESEKGNDPISNRISVYEIIAIAYASELGNREMYDESNQYSIRTMYKSIKSNRMFYLELSEYGLIWNYVQRTPKEQLDLKYIEEKIDNCIILAELNKQDRKVEFYKEHKKSWIPN